MNKELTTLRQGLIKLGIPLHLTAGPPGRTGKKGDKGDPGVGVPTGGTTGQVLTKNSNTDYDDSWQTPAASGVTSVTGVPPIASTGGTTPAISLQNSASVDITAALGTDTKFFTASGSAATNGHVITGDAQGGITDSGTALTSLVPTSRTISTTLPLAGGGDLSANRTLLLNPLVEFGINSGIVANPATLIDTTRQAGQVTSCQIIITASDPSTALTFKIFQNGVDVFSADPTVAAGTASGTVVNYTSLTSSPLSVAAGDKFYMQITSGSSAWQFIARLQ